MELVSIAEQSRLTVLQQYQILDGESERSFDGQRSVDHTERGIGREDGRG